MARGRREDNETIIKGGLSLFDGLDRTETSGGGERDAVIAVLRKHGYTEWPDGRSLEEVVK